jgi:hypothetical protein
MAEQKNPLDKLSKEDKLRLTKTSFLITSMTQFMRWSATFDQYEIKDHPNFQQVKLLSYLQSGRFSIAFKDEQAILGVQENEAVWLKNLPLDYCIADDRIYLKVSASEAMNIKFSGLTLAINVESKVTLKQLRKCDSLAFALVKVAGGEVTEIVEQLRDPINLLSMPLKEGLMHFQNQLDSEVKYTDFL